MTTASIYYHPRTDDPQFVLIDGERSNVRSEDYGTAPTLVGARIRAIDHACRRISWKVVGGAAIVRQADGRATIRVEPAGELRAAIDRAIDDANEQTAAELAKEAIAYITVEFNGTLGNVAVDGRTAPLPPGLTPEPTPTRRWMIDLPSLKAVDAALGQMGYARAGAIRYDGRTWQCRAERAAADWREVPTLVRINDAAAEVLQEASQKLGIPADQLASAWIGREAEHALRKQDSAVGRGGWLDDHSRIRGWMASGTPHLDTPGPIDYSRFVDKPKDSS